MNLEDKAREIRIAIEDDLNDRRGIGWDCLDEDTARKIRKKHKSLIEKRLSRLIADVRMEAKAEAYDSASKYVRAHSGDLNDLARQFADAAKFLREGEGKE